MKPFKTSLSALTGLAFFFCLFLLFFIIISFLSSLLLEKVANTDAAVRIATVLQDLFIFILPAVVTALIMTRLPAHFLFIDVAPPAGKTLLAIITLFLATPWLNEVIQWNESITFPENLKTLESALRSAEEAAANFIMSMLKGASIGSLVVSICIVGILAALSEELFFRGAMMRLFFLTRMNKHLAIWLVAFIFSLMHFQFFGFIPRMLLGAYFGYLVWWTRTLWVPVIVHAINNSVVIVAQWRSGGEADSLIEKNVISYGNVVIVCLSLVVTAVMIFLLQRNTGDND